jgi:uncharacterized membrane protein YphA (DoxX/SURF4 family)
MKRSIISEIISLVVVILFLYTGISKLMDYDIAKEQIALTPLLAPVAPEIAIILPVIEIASAILLFLPRTRRYGLWISLGLMVLFTGYVLFLLNRSGQVSCACGGVLEQLSPQQHLLFNTSCILLILLGITEARTTKQKRWFHRTAPLIAAVLIILAGGSIFISNYTNNKRKNGLDGSQIPSLNLLLADSITHLNTNDIASGKAIVIVGFSPTCPHCQAEISGIIAHIDKFKQTKIYFVTPFSFNAMTTLYKQLHLEKYSNITMGMDKKNGFLTFYQSTEVPYTAIYNSNKTLKAVIRGNVDMDYLSRITAE